MVKFTGGISFGESFAPEKQLLVANFPDKEDTITVTIAGDAAATADLEAGQVMLRTTATQLVSAYSGSGAAPVGTVFLGVLGRSISFNDLFHTNASGTKTATNTLGMVYTGGAFAKGALIGLSAEAVTGLSSTETAASDDVDGDAIITF